MSRVLRVFASGLRPGSVILDEEASRYVARVHRCTVGDELQLFDPKQSLVASALLTSIEGRQVIVEVLPPSLAPRHTMSVVLLQGVGKGDKPEQAIRDATALGAEEVILVKCERSVAKGGGATRMDRLMRVSEQVARQCERGDLPKLTGPLEFEETLARVPSPGRKLRRFVCAFHPQARPLLGAFASIDWSADSVELLVGPEGGLSDLEVIRALEAEFQPVDLGPYVLRTEAACTFALSVLRAASEAARLK